jgi:hypothetical protein
MVAVAETPMAVPPLTRQRCDYPPTGDVLRPRAQSRATAFGVSRPDAGRDVFRHRRGGAGRADVTRGRRAPSTPGGQPIRVLHDVPVNQRGRMIREADRSGDRELLCLDGITREPDRGVLVRGPKTLSESNHLRLSITPCRTDMARTRAQKSRMSVKRAPRFSSVDQGRPRGLQLSSQRLQGGCFVIEESFCELQLLLARLLLERIRSIQRRSQVGERQLLVAVSGT